MKKIKYTLAQRQAAMRAKLAREQQQQPKQAARDRAEEQRRADEYQSRTYKQRHGQNRSVESIKKNRDATRERYRKYRWMMMKHA